MKKTNFYFGFLRACMSLVLALIITNVQVNAQSCPIRLNDAASIGITTGTTNCTTPITPADLITVQGLIDLNACIGASNSVGVQIRRNGVWSPAIPAAGPAAIANATSSDVGKTLEVRVVVFNTTTRAIVNSNTGLIEIRDNQAPTITRCVRDVTLYCSQLTPSEFPSKALTGNFFAPAPTATGSQDGAFTDCTMLVEKDESYIDFEFTTDCKNPFESGSNDLSKAAPTAAQLVAKGLSATDAADVATRIGGLIGTGDVTRIIVRCWRLTDHYNNVSAPCYQIIVVRKIDLATANLVFPEDRVYSCSGADAACNLTAAPASLLPSTTGWPYIELNGTRGFQAGDLLLNDAPNSCNITVKFEDHREDVCKGSFKIFRKFTVRDWCNTGEPIEGFQAIKVLDFKQPIVRADFVDYGFAGGNLCYIDQWGNKTDYAVRRENPVRKDSVYFDGFEKQCGATSDGTVEILTAQADVNVCDRFFVRFTITACDPECTNGDVNVSANTNLLTRRVVRRFVDSKGINNVVYEFSGMMTDVNQDGKEEVTFTASDECGYALAKKTFRILTEDNAKPVATCISLHNTSLGTDGIARVYATTFNNGSKDNCGRIEKLMVRRMDGKAPQDPTTVAEGTCPGLVDNTCYADYIEFGCADAGKEIMVELVVIDQRGNFNSCMVRVIVDNKGTAICLAPPAATTSCIDIEKKIADPVRYGFGTAAAISNCGFTVSEVAPVSNFEACYPAGKNFFTRTWNVLDCEKKKVAECTQRITVTNVSDFTVDFPDDVVVGCFGDVPSKDALKAQMVDPASYAAGKDGAILNAGCGVLAVEIKDDTLMATNDLECMKILRKIKVIDWCKYNPNNDAVDFNTNCYGLPVCGDAHSNANWRTENVATWQNLWRGHLINKTTLPRLTSLTALARYYNWIVTGSASAGFAYTFPVDNPNWDKRFFCDSTRTFRELIRERRFRDADENILAAEAQTTFNGYFDYINWLVLYNGNLTSNPSSPNSELSYSDGIVCFTQVIKVIDRDKPVGKAVADARVCADNANCTGDYKVTLEATDKCSSTDPSTLATGLRFTWSVFSETSTKDPNFSSLLRDGSGAVIDLKGLAVGSYIIKWSVKDRCGNTSDLYTYRVTVRDCKAPEILTHDKNAELAWNQVAGTGMVSVTIDQVLNGVKDNCTPESFLRSKLGVEKVSSRPVVTVADYGTLPTFVMFTCADYKVNPVQQIRVWTIDEAGNANFVITTVTLQDNGNVCNGPRPAQLSGAVRTENNAAVAAVSVNTTGGGALMTSNTTVTGEYALSLFTGADYLIRAAKAGNDDKYAGLSTDDVGYIIRHALDVERIGSPFAHIAGDVNKDGQVDVADAFALRQFVLRKSNSLSAGVWRFVDKAYGFKNASNPLGEDFPEVVSIKAIGETAAANFVAVKVGDVSGNYKTVTPRSANTLSFETNDINLVAGNEYTVNVAANKLNARDFQGTFSFAKGTATIKSVKSGDLKDMSEGNFGIFADAVTTSWNGKETANANVVAITFVATKSAKLSDVFTFGSELTEAVATDANAREMNVNLKFNTGKVSGGEFALYQNTPNPVGNSGTLIKYNMPKEGTAKLTIYNVEGKVLMTQTESAKAGENTIEIAKTQLAAGVLYYRLETENESATKKMIIIE